ncbi:hypothetical protein PPYR_10463 [Photinus pyralis]|uniref:Peptidase M14 domain-containing protein n=1 Tax=Photinus pyralis TaxID=7054 RepID=A0A5N4AGC5_PHOPY|nr:hypothetical protein PPYR_10463 [Photinus pyralis]
MATLSDFPVQHGIITNGHPVFDRPHRLTGERFAAMQNANILYEVIPFTYEQKKLLEFLETGLEIGIWQIVRKSKRSFHISVPLYFRKEFENAFGALSFNLKLLGREVKASTSNHQKICKSAPALRDAPISFKKYHRYGEIQDYLKYLSLEYPNTVCLQNYGVSYENRPLTLAYVSTGGSKPIILIDAGMHAREWITPAQALYILHALIEKKENKYLIEKVDWIIVPVANPDGYEYSHTVDRFWRKTRSKLKNGARGVDPNRNFDFQWMQDGASRHEVSQTYCGPCPFSEPETKFLSRLIIKNLNQIKLYISFHSFRQCIAYPFGYTHASPHNAYEMHQLAARAEEAIYRVHGNHYDVGSTLQVMRKMSGSSTDWAYGAAGIDLCYTFELPGGGTRGFDLPASAIPTVVTEVFAGIKVFHKYVQLNYTK